MYTKNNEIFDLQETTSALFQTEALPWQISSIYSGYSKTSVCAGTYLVAGYGVLKPTTTIQRTYTSLQAHSSVFITFEAYMMGAWYTSDRATIKVKSGSTEVASSNLLNMPSNTRWSFSLGGYCNSYSDSVYTPYTFYISTPHSGSDLTLLFTISPPYYDGTLGIRNVQILLSNIVLTASTQCTPITGMSNTCPCPAGQRKVGSSCSNCDASCASCTASGNCYSCASNYYYTGVSCLKCFNGCGTCSAGAETNCLTCQATYFMYPNSSCKAACPSTYKIATVSGIQKCNFPCTQITDFYYPDGNCRSVCTAPFTQETDANGVKFCKYPCGTSGNYYYNADTTCRATCASPYKPSTDATGAKFCDSPCTSGQFYYPDTACRATCDLPFISVTTYGAKFCNYPCATASNYYYNADSTCRATCTSPYKPSTDATGAKFCDSPCASGQFYYPDTVCRAACDSPFTSTTTYGAKFCSYPCTTTASPFYFPDAICRATCDLPYKANTDATGAKFCNAPCSTAGESYYPDGICRAACDSPFTTATTYGAKFCNNPCTVSSNYYYNSDTICRAACDPPFISVTTNGVRFCNSPCPSGQFYYPDGNCRAACDSPFTSTTANGLKFCSYPCGTTGNYYFPDRSCQSTCNTPYKAVTDQTGAKFCNLPCDSGQYYYPDGNCRATCNLPFTSSADSYGAKFCAYPCSTTGNYYYEDGTCQPACLLPFISFTDSAGAKFCKRPCDSADYYYSRDGTCRISCDAPFASSTDATGAKTCNYPCNSDEYRGLDGSCVRGQCPDNFEVKEYYGSSEYKYCECVSPNTLTVDGICNKPVVVDPVKSEPEPAKDPTIESIGSVGNATGVINSVGLVIAAVALPGDPGGVSTGALTKIIQYSKFLNVSYPEKLIVMFKAYNPASGIVSFVPKMSDEQRRKFNYEPLPYNFMAYGVHSCFIVNFWNFMIFLMVLFGVCAGCLIVEKLSDKAGVWARKVRAILQNFWIVQLYNSSGDIVLFSIIQFKNNHWDSSEDTLSFLMAIFFMLMLMTVFVFHWRTSMEYQRVKKESEGESLKRFEKNYECQQIFYESFVDRTSNHQLYLLYFALRIMLHNLIIATLINFPVLQTVLMTSLSLLLVLYIFTKRPFKSKIDLAQNLTYELIILSVNITLLTFASLDGDHKGTADTRNNLAQLIIICSVMFTFLSLFFIALKVILVAIQFYKEWRQKKAKGGPSKLDLEKSNLGLQIKQPRDFSHLGTKNTEGESSDLQQLDLSDNNMENSQPLRIKNQTTNGKKKRILSLEVPEAAAETPLDLSASLYPMNNLNNTTLQYRYDSALDLSMTYENPMERERNQLQQDQISLRVQEEIGFSSTFGANSMRKSRLQGIKRRMLNQRELSKDDDNIEETIMEPQNEVAVESPTSKSRKIAIGLKRRMPNGRNVDASEMSRPDRQDEIRDYEENLMAEKQSELQGMKRRMFSD